MNDFPQFECEQMYLRLRVREPEPEAEAREALLSLLELAELLTLELEREWDKSGTCSGASFKRLFKDICLERDEVSEHEDSVGEGGALYIVKSQRLKVKGGSGQLGE